MIERVSFVEENDYSKKDTLTMVRDNKHRLNGTGIILLLILLLTVFTSPNEFAYPVIPISPTYRGFILAVILLIGAFFRKENKSKYLRLDVIETLLFIRIIHYSFIVLIYASREYLLNFLSLFICFFAYSWSSKTTIERGTFLRWIEVFSCSLDIQTIIAALITQRAGIQLYLIKTNIVAPVGASNFITTFVVMMFPFVYKWETNKIIKNSILVLTIACIFMSRSNSGLIVFVVLIIVLLAVEKRYRVLKMFGTFLIMGSIVYIIDKKYTGYLSRFIDSMRLLYKGGLSGNFSVTNGRDSIYHEVIRLITKRPIIGYGFNYRSMIINQLTAHNWILESLVTGGFFSLMLYLLIFGYYLKRIVRNETLGIHDKHAFVISLLVVLLQGLVETSLGSLVFDVIFWLIIGQGIHYCKIKNVDKGYE